MTRNASGLAAGAEVHRPGADARKLRRRLFKLFTRARRGRRYFVANYLGADFLVRGGEIVADVFRLVLAQIRSKHETAGDFRAQVAANTTGGRRLLALLDRLAR